MNTPTDTKQDQSVYVLTRAARCFNCDKRLEPGDLARLQEGVDEQEVICGQCAKLDGLVVVPSGNAKVTRSAKKLAKTCYVILKWSELWKTYERQGLLIDEATATAIKESAK